MAATRATWTGWVRQARGFVAMVVVLTAFRSAVADWNDVPTGSMRPTILEGDRIFVNKVAYDLKVPYTTWRVAEWGGPARGDVVVFESPEDGVRMVKRVIGVPGDVVEMREERLTINGVAAEYRGASLQGQHVVATEGIDGRRHAVMATPGMPAMRSFGPVTVPAGAYLVLGDNRDNSKDSRYIGFVPREKILGRAVGVAMSLDPENYYRPRWERWGEGLGRE